MTNVCLMTMIMTRIALFSAVRSSWTSGADVEDIADNNEKDHEDGDDDNDPDVDHHHHDDDHDVHLFEELVL